MATSDYDLSDDHTRAMVAYFTADHLPLYHYDRARLPNAIVDCIEAWIVESYASPRPFHAVQDEITDAVARYHRERLRIVQ